MDGCRDLWQSKGDEDLARKTTGKTRDPKPLDQTPLDQAAADATGPAIAPETKDPVATASMQDDSIQPTDIRSDQTAAAIDDAEVVSETPPPALAPEVADDVPEQDAPQNASEQPDLQDDRAPDAETPRSTPADTPPPAASALPRPSVLPMVLGGVVAAALGYGAHMLTQTAPAPVLDVSTFEADLASLRADVQGINMPAPYDPTPLQEQIAALGTAIDELQNAEPAIDPAKLDALGVQVQAIATGAATLTAEMGTLRADMDSLKTTIAALQADMADLRSLAQTRVTEAEAAVDAALARAGLDSIRAALDTGAPFGAAVTQIVQAGFDVPAPLASIAAAGIVTPEALTESFDASARAALRASLTDAPATTTTERLGNFLRAQVGARSTVPRDGDDADAVLSRAGAAVEAGDFDTALAELESLPEAGRAAMADWIDAATARAAALAALPELSQAIAP